MLVELVVWGAKNDPRTTVPGEFVRRFDEDRKALIESIRESVASSNRN
jgi:hypothetical protein